QIDTPGRGFSFQSEGPLDMRMDRGGALTAADIVNEGSRDEIERIIGEYGEERQARSVANAIVRSRAKSPLTSTTGLAETIRSAVRRRWAIKSCARVFQALRIAVNQELDRLRTALDNLLPLLSGRGRFGVISYHSLEDRMVKRTFETWASDCICPPGLPQCVCEHERVAVLHTRRAVVASREEVTANPRARSARFRMIERLPDDRSAR
ncbi:MAG: 16S rRNA (cytosine(1402)-N(4))-methyltransferase RsmH, partial [Gemmatimonadetes bacterium]|nr:16S rRNA (cytosine(1402)-N(4))-methyltransferase RsmH [Gemmatimonadota bacterium]